MRPASSSRPPRRGQPRQDRTSKIRLADPRRLPARCAATILDELDAIYAKSPLPLAPRAREALVAARDLAAELADGLQDRDHREERQAHRASARRSSCPCSIAARDGIPRRGPARELQVVHARRRRASGSELHQLYLLRRPREARRRSRPTPRPRRPSPTSTPRRCCSRSPIPIAWSRARSTGSSRSARACRGLATLGQRAPGDQAGRPLPRALRHRQAAQAAALRRATTPAGPTGACSTPTRSWTSCARRKQAAETGNVSADHRARRWGPRRSRSARQAHHALGRSAQARAPPRSHGRVARRASASG